MWVLHFTLLGDYSIPARQDPSPMDSSPLAMTLGLSSVYNDSLTLGKDLPMPTSASAPITSKPVHPSCTFNPRIDTVW